MIDVTELDIRKLVANVYNMSVPVGMGRLHYTGAPLSEEEITSLIDMSSNYPVSMDYIKGRQCKFTIRKEDDVLYIADEWLDHSEEQLETLLKNSS